MDFLALRQLAKGERLIKQLIPEFEANLQKTSRHGREEEVHLGPHHLCQGLR